MNNSVLPPQSYDHNSVAIAQSKVLAIRESAAMLMNEQFYGLSNGASSQVLNPIVQVMNKSQHYDSSVFGYAKGALVLFDKLRQSINLIKACNVSLLNAYLDILRESEADALLNASAFRRRERAINRELNDIQWVDRRQLTIAQCAFGYRNFVGLNLIQLKKDREAIMKFLTGIEANLRVFWRLNFSQASGFWIHILPVFNRLPIGVDVLIHWLEDFWQKQTFGNGLFSPRGFDIIQRGAVLAAEDRFIQLKHGLSYLANHAPSFPIKPSKQYQEFGVYIPSDSILEEL